MLRNCATNSQRTRWRARTLLGHQHLIDSKIRLQTNKNDEEEEE